jgi:phosphoserine phosphatase RsbU/P
MKTSHILLVDDNELNRDMLARRVRQQGYTFDLAENGREALEKMSATPYDLILLDIMMPEVDGYTVLQQAKSSEALRHIPIIMISAIDEIENTARCIEMGADDYLTKPFNPTLLKARIQSSLEKKYLRDKEQHYSKSMEQDLEIGRTIQSSFFPQTLPTHPNWEVVPYFRSARQVSGDFYDAFPLVGQTHMGIVIADVCDKGVGAALFMALFRTLIRALSENNFPAQSADLQQIATGVQKTITQTNEYIAKIHGDANMFATIFFGVQNLETGLLQYANGGHEPPFLKRANGNLEFLTPTGSLVGALSNLQFQTQTVQINVSDTLLCFTDGVTEAKNTEGQLFTEKNLPDLIQENLADSISNIVHALDEFTQGAPQFDDITMLGLKRKA